MSGFGIYETLRILIPGWFVVAFLDLGARLAFGPTPFRTAGHTAGFVGLIEEPLIGLGIALVAGLLLYAMDVPTKTAVMMIGDPVNGKELPSQHLKAMLTNPDLQGRAMSLYFLIQDQFMNQEAHRKVYLFGSLYRIFVDLRMLAATFFVTSVVVGLGFADSHGNGWPLGWTSALVAVWLAPYLYDFGQHARNSVKKYGDSFRDFLIRRRPEGSIWRLGILVLLVNTLGTVLSLVGGLWHRIGGVLALMGVGLWLRLEVGGSPNDRKWPGFWWGLARLSGTSTRGFSTTHQRALLDMGTFLPWVLGAGVLSGRLGRADAWILAWLVFLVPLSLVLGFHKHEDRLRNSFGDQNLWLDLHADKIAEIDRSGRLPVKWWS